MWQHLIRRLHAVDESRGPIIGGKPQVHAAPIWLDVVSAIVDESDESTDQLAAEGLHAEEVRKYVKASADLKGLKIGVFIMVLERGDMVH